MTHPNSPLQVNSSCSKATDASGDTLVRKPSEDVATEQKPTPRKPGHWRNWWFAPIGGRDAWTRERVPAGEYIAKRKYPSRELAEQWAMKTLDESAARGESPPTYLGPVFFPDEGDAS